MSRELTAQEAEKLASALSRLADDLENGAAGKPDPFLRTDPTLKRVANLVYKATKGDLGDMMTVVVMALKAGGHIDAANRVYSMLKPMVPKVEKKFGL